MKAQEVIQNLFNELKLEIKSGNPKQGMGKSIATIMTLAWVLDKLPEKYDQLLTLASKGKHSEAAIVGNNIRTEMEAKPFSEQMKDINACLGLELAA